MEKHQMTFAAKKSAKSRTLLAAKILFHCPLDEVRFSFPFIKTEKRMGI